MHFLRTLLVASSALLALAHPFDFVKASRLADDATLSLLASPEPRHGQVSSRSLNIPHHAPADEETLSQLLASSRSGRISSRSLDIPHHALADEETLSQLLPPPTPRRGQLASRSLDGPYQPPADADLLKHLAQPPRRSALTKRSMVLDKRARYGCDRGYEQCPGYNYCCQAGLTCFADGTCGNIEEMTCMKGETECGTGTRAGCCAYGTSCTADGQCVLNNGATRGTERGVAMAGVGMGLAAMGWLL